MAGLNTFSTKITQNNWVFFLSHFQKHLQLRGFSPALLGFLLHASENSPPGPGPAQSTKRSAKKPRALLCGLKPSQQERLAAYTHLWDQEGWAGQGWDWASKVPSAAGGHGQGRSHQPPAMPSLLSKHTLAEITDGHSPALLIQAHHPANSQHRGQSSLHKQLQPQGSCFQEPEWLLWSNRPCTE